jgi:hypothetical protein
MRRSRFTIARCMIWTAVLAVNAGLVRAYVVQEMFYGGILIFIALQVGLWCLLHSRGLAHNFWLGFEVSGVFAVLAMFSCEVFPEPPCQLCRVRHNFHNADSLIMPPWVPVHESRVTSVQDRGEPRASDEGASVDPTDARNASVRRFGLRTLKSIGPGLLWEIRRERPTTNWATGLDRYLTRVRTTQSSPHE